MSSRELRRLEPALAATVRGGLWLPDDHQVDNRRLLAALLDACARAGVSVVEERAVGITARRIELASGAAIEADDVVVATGAWPAPLTKPGDDGATVLPVRPVKGQIVRVRATTGAVAPQRTVRGLDVYVVPRRHGEIAIGATSEEKGFDTTVTAGAVHELLRDARELLPGLAEAEFVEVVAGLRPGTPDNAPLLGRLAGDGPVIATGHYRHGVLLAPATAAVVGALVMGRGDASMVRLAEPFDPARFSTDGAAGATGPARFHEAVPS
jgi:glycine oxidase